MAGWCGPNGKVTEEFLIRRGPAKGLTPVLEDLRTAHKTRDQPNIEHTPNPAESEDLLEVVDVRKELDEKRKQYWGDGAAWSSDFKTRHMLRLRPPSMRAGIEGLHFLWASSSEFRRHSPYAFFPNGKLTEEYFLPVMLYERQVQKARQRANVGTQDPEPRCDAIILWLDGIINEDEPSRDRSEHIESCLLQLKNEQIIRDPVSAQQNADMDTEIVQVDEARMGMQAKDEGRIRERVVDKPHIRERKISRAAAREPRTNVAGHGVVESSGKRPSRRKDEPRQTTTISNVAPIPDQSWVRKLVKNNRGRREPAPTPKVG